MPTIPSRLFRRSPDDHQHLLAKPLMLPDNAAELPAGWTIVGDSIEVARYWNTVGTLGAGGIADIDQAGSIFPRWRDCMVSVWLGAGDRWVLPAGASTQQTRLGGMPVVETKIRVGSHGDDVTMRTWGDEPGSGLGRIVVEIENTATESVSLAVAVQPFRLTGLGSIHEIRIADQRMVVDGLPLLEFERAPADAASAAAPASLLDALRARVDADRADGKNADDETSPSSGGHSAQVVAFPLLAGATQRFFVVDGREDATVAAAPVQKVVSGWQTHMEAAAEFVLPMVPKHLPVSAIAGLTMVRPGEGSELVGLAATRVGLPWVAREQLRNLLDAMAAGSLARDRFADVGILIANLCVRGELLPDELVEYVDVSVAALAELIGSDIDLHDRADAVRAVAMIAGDEAASDAGKIKPRRVNKTPSTPAWVLRTRDSQSAEAALVDSGTQDPLRLARRMIDRSQGLVVPDFIVPMRAAAGATWRWPERIGRDGTAAGLGDSPDARAMLVFAMSGMVVGESIDGLELLPGFAPDWLGRNLEVNRLSTRFGQLSFALRWHGERPALLWEHQSGQSNETSPVLTCRAIDPSWSTTASSGETLLQV